ncbi:MAG: MFS transporter [Acidimicrobiia bacterium]|nr:MFS transporter [bacterium]MYB79583.1 MFS transporter [Acidimicrobiia bacterium]
MTANPSEGPDTSDDKLRRPSPAQVPWAIVLAGAVIGLLSMGIRQSLGVFLLAVSEDLGPGREPFSLAVAVLSFLMGLPVAGYLADRYDHRRVLLVCSLLYGGSLVTVSTLQTSGGLVLYLGVMAGLGTSGLSFGVLMGAVGRLVPAGRRSAMMGVVAGGTSMGMLLVAPAAQFGLEAFGWRASFATMGAMVLAMSSLAFLFPRQATMAAAQDGALDEPFGIAVRKARRNRSYLLLTAGFFVNGFHIGMIVTHLPAYLIDGGITGTMAALVLAVIGGVNIFSSPMFGRLGDRLRKRNLLILIYGTRAVLIAALLVLPLSPASALGFGLCIGVMWMGAVPLTSATVAHLLGARYLSALFGVVFFSHQIGASIGGWLPGRVFDATGSYLPVWLLAIGLSVAALLIHLPIKDQGAPARG